MSSLITSPVKPIFSLSTSVTQKELRHAGVFASPLPPTLPVSLACDIRTQEGRAVRIKANGERKSESSSLSEQTISGKPVWGSVFAFPGKCFKTVAMPFCS